MPLTRCSEQKRQTLEEFYTEWASSDDQNSVNLGKSMLVIVNLIDKMFLETKIYGLTSHAHLLLLSLDKSESDRYVSIIANGHEFYIEYLLPKNKQPWTNACVKGSTKTIDEFKKYLIIGMTESLGWKDSSELKTLYQSIVKVTV